MTIPAALLLLHNNAVYALAVVILLSLLIDRRFTGYLAAFLLLTVSGLILTVIGKSHLTMPAAICILTLFFSAGRCNLLHSFSRSLTAVFLTWCFITPLSCLVMVAAPQWHNGPGCNLFTGIALTLYAVSLRWVPGIAERLQGLAPDKYVIALELLVLSFFTLLLPQYFPAFAVESKRQIGLFTLAFFILLAFFGFILTKMQRAERQRRELAAHLEQQQQFQRQTQRQFDTVMALKHYYFKLYQGMAPLVQAQDMAGLTAYFEQYIATVHRKRLRKQEPLSNIRNTVIRNLLDVTITQVDSGKEIALELAVEGVIRFPDALEMDVFEVLCNLLDNAMKELEGQSSGLLRIILQCDEAMASILVANTLREPVGVERLYRQEKSGGELHGHGLNRIREIVCQHPEMEHFTYMKGMYRAKKILVQ